MRPMSKAAKAEAYDALKKEHDLYANMIYFLINSSGPNAFQVEARHAHETPTGEVYEWRLYGTCRAAGGILLTLVHHNNAPSSADVVYYDDWLTKARAIHWATEDKTGAVIREAAEVLDRKRRELHAPRESIYRTK